VESARWTAGEIVWDARNAEDANPMDAVIVQKSDSTILLNIRRSFDQTPPVQGTSNYRVLSSSPDAPFPMDKSCHGNTLAGSRQF
jgi:hypothetical protein